MYSINYIIATAADAIRSRIRDPYSLLTLQYHLNILSSMLKTDGLIKQVTIVRQDSKIDNSLKNEYYNIEKYVEEIKKKNVKVEILDTEKLGISYTQYLLAYEKFSSFDYYIIMEDDWLINNKYKDFDHLLLGLYSKCFPSGRGFLDCWSPRRGKYVGPNGGFKNYPHHSCISVGLLNNSSMKKISEKIKSREERKNLDQLAFSLAAKEQGIEIMDLPTAGLNTRILFWSTGRNAIIEYTETQNLCNPVFVPVQFYYKNVDLASPDNRQIIHFTNEDILEQSKLLEKIVVRKINRANSILETRLESTGVHDNTIIDHTGIVDREGLPLERSLARVALEAPQRVQLAVPMAKTATRPREPGDSPGASGRKSNTKVDIAIVVSQRLECLNVFLDLVKNNFVNECITHVFCNLSEKDFHDHKHKIDMSLIDFFHHFPDDCRMIQDTHATDSNREKYKRYQPLKLFRNVMNTMASKKDIQKFIYTECDVYPLDERKYLHFLEKSSDDAMFCSHTKAGNERSKNGFVIPSPIYMTREHCKTLSQYMRNFLFSDDEIRNNYEGRLMTLFKKASISLGQIKEDHPNNGFFDKNRVRETETTHQHNVLNLRTPLNQCGFTNGKWIQMITSRDEITTSYNDQIETFDEKFVLSYSD